MADDREPLPEVSKFLALEVQLEADRTHVLFLKEHSAAAPSSASSPADAYPAKRTLFVANLPPTTTEEHLRTLLLPHGEIERTDLHLRREPVAHLDELTSAAHRVRPWTLGGSTAHVVFASETGLKKALAMKVRKRLWGKGIEAPAYGLERWMQDYKLRRPNLAKLQKEMDEYMAKFDSLEAKARAERQAVQNKMDDDGFTLVVRGGRRQTSKDGKGTVVTVAKAADAEEVKKKKKTELVDFYRFQQRQTKRNQLAELRKKFEEDKKKIAELRANRRFNPY